MSIPGTARVFLLAFIQGVERRRLQHMLLDRSQQLPHAI